MDQGAQARLHTYRNPLRSFTNSWCLAAIPRDSDLRGLGRGLGFWILKSSPRGFKCAAKFENRTTKSCWSLNSLVKPCSDYSSHSLPPSSRPWRSHMFQGRGSRMCIASTLHHQQVRIPDSRGIRGSHPPEIAGFSSGISWPWPSREFITR